MSALPAAGAVPAGRRRSARWLIILTHVPIVMLPVAIGSFNLTTLRSLDPVAPLLISAAIGVLQIRHSLAAARGMRPRGGAWTLAALALLVYLPMPWFGSITWTLIASTVAASALMVLGNTAGLVTAIAAVAVAGVAAPLIYAQTSIYAPMAPFTVPELLYHGVTSALLLAMHAAFLYGAARLARALEELRETRMELADLAVNRERLRISRDLHDLLGQSLSAIALKGDLALHVLRADVRAARDEIEEISGIARDALRGVRAVTRDAYAASLGRELEGAAALLRTAGIAARVDSSVPDLPPPVAEILAWAVREGIANVLRHSSARTCSILVTRAEGSVVMEIANDGAAPAMPPGRGLTGLAERAGALAGTVTTARTDDGRFSLLVRLPAEGDAP